MLYPTCAQYGAAGLKSTADTTITHITPGIKQKDRISSIFVIIKPSMVFSQRGLHNMGLELNFNTGTYVCASVIAVH